MSAGLLKVHPHICWLEHISKARYMLANMHIVHMIFLGQWLYVAKRYISAGSLKVHPHICQLEHIKQSKIYVGRHAYSAHDIPGPMRYMQLKDISRPRLAGMLYAHV